MIISPKFSAPREPLHRILVVDDDPDIRGALTGTIELFDEYSAHAASNQREALKSVDEIQPDLVLLDINLGASSGLDLLPIIKERSPNTIVIIMTAYRDNKYTIQALKNGADDYLLKPFDIEVLLPQLEIFLRKREAFINSLNTINNLQIMLEQTNKLLFLLDYNGSLLETTSTALQLVNSKRDTVIGLPFQDTPWWCQSAQSIKSIQQAINSAKNGDHTHMELTTRLDDKDMHLEMMIKPILDQNGDIEFFIVDGHDITERKQMEENLRLMAQYDPLTGLANRNLFHEHLKLSEAQASRRQGRFAVFFIDLDNFKLLNDRFGHDAGDDFLVTVSSGMSNILRDADVLARLGGDEFAAILTDISMEFDPIGIATRLLETVQNTPLPASADFELSSSIGIAIYPEHSTDAEQLLKMADEAMYHAKQAGKNTIRQYISMERCS